VLASCPMRALCALCVLLALPAFAQKEVLFNLGKPVSFKEQEIDKRFKKSRLAKALETGTDDPACTQLLGGLFFALAEAAPSFHNKDDTFALDPVVMNALETQLSTPVFPASAYLVAMVRRVRIEGKLPDAWLETAKAVNAKVQIIDLGRLRYLNEEPAPIDSINFTLSKLRERYVVEVLQANSAFAADAPANFRDAYLDREIAWGGATLIDAGARRNQPLKKGKKPVPGMEELVAIFGWLPPEATPQGLQFFGKAPAEKPRPVQIFARLKSKQYVDLEKIPRGHRMLVKGRFWEMNQSIDEVEVRDALIFEDRDFSHGLVLGEPGTVAQCPFALNEVTGVAPQQMGGFKH